MLPLSLLAFAGSFIAYLICKEIPFTVPFSLLGNAQNRAPYHIILALFTAATLPYALHTWRAGSWLHTALAGAALGLLVTLQFYPNEARGHDTLACTVIVLACTIAICIAQRQEHALLMWLALGSFVGCSVLFTQNMLLVGLAENLVLGTTLFAMNVEYREPLPVVVATGSSPYRTPTLRVPHWWRRGMSAGLTWGLGCVLISGVCGMLTGALAGPFLALTCAGAGYLAWRDDYSIWLRAPLLGGIYGGTIAALAALGSARLTIETVAPMACLFFGVFLVMFLVELHSPS